MSVLNARYRVVSAQGEISGQAYLDPREMATRKRDAATNAVNTYGGYDKNNLSLKTGELMIGRRTAPPMKNAQLGYSSMNAFNFEGFHTDEQIMRAHKFIGVVKTDEELEENNYGQLPGSEGAAVLLAGSYTITNNNSQGQTIPAGGILAWQIPPSGLTRRHFDVNQAGVRMYKGEPMGTPYTKALIEVVPFDPSDFSMQLEGAAVLFGIPKAQGGVSDATLEDFQNSQRKAPTDRPWTTLQEEALGWKFGLIGLLGNRSNDELRELMRNPAIQTLCQAITGAWYAKASRIIGKAMSGGKVGASIDAMIGIFKVGI